MTAHFAGLVHHFKKRTVWSWTLYKIYLIFATQKHINICELRMSQRVLLSTKWIIFQQYHKVNQCFFYQMMMMPVFVHVAHFILRVLYTESDIYVALPGNIILLTTSTSFWYYFYIPLVSGVTTIPIFFYLIAILPFIVS